MSIYTDAREYVRDLGWALVPIPPNTKGPNQPGWNAPENLITTEEACSFWESHPTWNMGAQLQESGIVVLDIDNVEYTKLLFSAFGLDYDTVLAGAPRIKGKDGHDKAIFSAPDIELSRKALSWPYKDDPKKQITVIEFRAGPIQDVLPPSMHPDTKRPYEWVHKPYDAIPDLPKKILTIWKEWDRFKPQLRSVCPWAVKDTIPQPQRRKTSAGGDSIIKEFNAHNDVESLLRQYGYTRVSENRYLSPFSSSGLAGVIVFPAEQRIFSHHASEPFDTEHSLDAFDLYCQFEHNGNVTAACRALRQDAGIVMDVTPEEVEHGKELVAAITRDKDAIPEELLTVPGCLSNIVDYYNDTAPKRQPQFAVQTALAIGSVAMGRRWRTDQQNFTSLYFINIAKSSAGKEHAKTVIENILTAAQLETLIGPPGYTSSGGVISALIDQPAHIGIIDEFGRLIESTNRANNSNKLDAQTIMMEAFGRLSSTLRPQGYSTMTMTDKQKQQMTDKEVQHPALTLMCMTTPDTFYGALSSSAISSGFLPRFLVVESDTGRQPSRRVESREVPEKLVKWVQRCATAHTPSGNLSDDFGPLSPPDPVVIPFEDAAWQEFERFEADIIKRQNLLDAFGIASMLGRTKEIAMRLSLIVAVSCGHAQILEEDAEWAIRYVKFYANQTINKIRARISNTDFEAIVKEVVEVIRDGGAMGKTEREISKLSPLFRGSDDKRRDSVMAIMVIDYPVRLATITHEGGGRPRTAYVWTGEGE
ncbi:MAG: DUF3987 domain-containing protein [Sphaerochaetaceae bacterium]